MEIPYNTIQHEFMIQDHVKVRIASGALDIFETCELNPPPGGVWLVVDGFALSFIESDKRIIEALLHCCDFSFDVSDGKCIDHLPMDIFKYNDIGHQYIKNYVYPLRKSFLIEPDIKYAGYIEVHDPATLEYNLKDSRYGSKHQAMIQLKVRMYGIKHLNKTI